jgi:hypothetical protein
MLNVRKNGPASVVGVPVNVVEVDADPIYAAA